VAAFDLRVDSGGPGANSGGIGARFPFRLISGGELSIETSRTLEGSPGVNGGSTSPVQVLVQEKPDGTRRGIGGLADDGSWRSPLLSSHRFAPGDSFEFLSTGGGGWGDALTRDPERVREDVVDGYVSAEFARRDYRVVIDPASGALDREATAALRREAAR